MNHGYVLATSSKSLNENCPIASSNVFLTVFHISQKSSNSPIAKLKTKQKIIKMIPYKIMNFAKSWSIEKKILIKGPKNQLPLSTKTN